MKLILFALLALLTGCRLGPRYEVPPVITPENWKAPQEFQPEAIPSLDDWWEIFDDETLNDLEQRALANSPTLYAAIEKIIQARATAGVRNADLYPQLTLDPRFKYEENYYNVHFGKLRQLFPTLPLRPNFTLDNLEYSLPLDLSYQLDLWGKWHGLYDSAFLNAQAEEQAYYATLLTLTSDLASAYFQLRTLDAQIRLYQETLQAREQNVANNESRYKKGLASLIDYTNATVQL